MTKSKELLALIRAIKTGNTLEVSRLIHTGVDLEGTNAAGWTPLVHAANKGQTKILEILIGAGADVNHGYRSGFTALYSAVLSDHLQAVKILLKAGAKPYPVGDDVPLSKNAGYHLKNRKEIIRLIEAAERDG